MPEEDRVKCGCNESGRPLWGFCEDDFYCPQCGRPVAWLRSDYQYPSDDPKAAILVYPQKKAGFAIKQYTFPLSLSFAGPARQRQERSPAVDFQRSSLLESSWFETRIEKLEHDRGRILQCRLIRRGEGHAGATLPDELELPEEGFPIDVTLMGDFDQQTFSLLVCSSPQIVIELEEARGALERVDETQTRWEVRTSDALDVELTIRAPTAPVRVVKGLGEIDLVRREAPSGQPPEAGRTVHLTPPLAEGRSISPQSPWKSRFRLNGLRDGEKCRLLLALRTAVVHLPPVALDLERVDKGQLLFSPRPFAVEVMYAGEVRSNAPEGLEGRKHHGVIPPLRVMNVGREPVTLQPPQAQPGRDYGVPDWITAKWAPAPEAPLVRPGEQGSLELQPGQQGEILVRVDLRGFTRVGLPSDRALQAWISTVDQWNRCHRVEFRLGEIKQREPAEYPLAIDFGNSHSFAAMWNPGAEFRHSGPIVSVHDLDIEDREQFPTALFFLDLSDPDHPVYEIGRVALRLGGSQAHALVTDLKRRIGVPDRWPYRNVCDSAGEKPHTLPLRTLVHLYLERLIERAESHLRRWWITRIGVSYPSRFDPERRAAFQQVIREFCDRSAETSPRGPLAVVDFDVDEANAVAIDFVLDEDVRQNELPQVVNAENRSFVVASFDLGGGSLDTALLRFEVEEGSLSNPVFRSQYLGIGGDEDFGGDNVTCVFLDLLKGRIKARLEGASAAQGLAAWIDRLQAPQETDTPISSLSRNYGALWRAAECIKIYQSRSAVEPLQEDALHKLKHDLREQLLHQLVFDEGTEPQASALRNCLEEAIDQDGFLIALDEAYDLPIQPDPGGSASTTVRERLEMGVEEICKFARRRQVRVDYVVLGGSGSRLPLVQQIFQEKLPKARLVYDPRRTKSRVAFGLVRYLEVKDRRSEHKFARSCDYTTREIGYRPPGTVKLLTVIPNCSPVDDEKIWYPLGHEGKPFRIDSLGRRIDLYRQGADPMPTRIGRFDLTEPPAAPARPTDETILQESPQAFSADGRAEVRLLGCETNVELRLFSGGQYYGCWPLKPETPGDSPRAPGPSG